MIQFCKNINQKLDSFISIQVTHDSFINLDQINLQELSPQQLEKCEKAETLIRDFNIIDQDKFGTTPDITIEKLRNAIENNPNYFEKIKNFLHNPQVENFDSILLMRVTKDYKKEKKILRPASIASDYTEAFQHGETGDVCIYLAKEGWYFKHDSGTNRVLKLNEVLRHKLQKVFVKNKQNNDEDNRQFGCILMSLADLQKKYPELFEQNKETITKLYNATSLEKVIEISTQLKNESKTYSECYKYWNIKTRSLSEGQDKHREINRRLSGSPNNKLKSSKHVIAEQIKWDDCNIVDIRKTVYSTLFLDEYHKKFEIEDKGHLIRKFESITDDKLLEYVLLGKISNELNDDSNTNKNPDNI